jgi:tetratricopeptide (TPR) repeat protein
MKTALLLLLLLRQSAPVSLVIPELSPPTKTGVAPTPTETPILREGIALYDQGKFDDAAARFEQVLKNNPESVSAMYELAQTYQARKEFQKAIDLAAKGTQYIAPPLPQFYALIGNVLDINGQPQKAVETYKKGLALNTPNSGTLYVNLGATQMTSLKDVPAAKATYKQGALSDPNFPGNHLQLGFIYAAQGLKTPMLLALGRFLVLESNSTRSQTAYSGWRAMLDNRETPPTPPTSPLYAYVTSSQQTGEGDQDQLQAALVSSKAAAAAPGKSQIQLLVDQVDNLFGTYATLQPGNSKDTFLWKYYIPYAIEMKQKGFVEPFVYFANQRVNIPGVREWLTANPDKVNAFLLWARTYRWPDKNSVNVN